MAFSSFANKQYDARE